MLQAIRNQAASWVVKLLFVLLIVSFTAWGVTDYLNQGGRTGPAVMVGEAALSQEAVNNAVTAEMQRMRQFLGQGFDREQARMFGLIDQVVDGMVGRTLVELEAKRLGVVIDDATVRQAIQADPNFAGADGRFDRVRFAALINRAGYSEERFIAEIRGDLARNQILRAIGDPGVVPASLVGHMLRWREERRVAEFVTLGEASVAPLPEPTDDQLRALHTAEIARFSTPEHRRLLVARLDAATLAAEVEIGPAEIEAAYAQRLDEFSTPERRRIEQVLFADEAQARTALDKIKGGAPFEKVAEEDAATTPAQADLGRLTKAELPAGLAEPAFAAQPDEVVGPVRTNFGWHLLRISEVQAESRTPLDEVRARLGEELRVERATDLVFRRSTRFEDDLLAGATLDESARRFGVTPVTLDAVSRTGRTPDDAVPPALLGADVALREAFTLEAGRRTNLIALADDRFVAIQVLAIDPPAPRPFETVADEVRASWVAAERDKALAALADRVTAALVAGAPIAQVAEDAKASVTISEPFGRDGGGGQLPRQVTTALFANAVGSVSGGRHADGWVVARLTEIRAVDPAQATDQVTAITRQFRAAVEQDLGQQFQEALRKRYPVKVNRQAVDGLL